METIRDGIELCVDCLIVAASGDTSGIESEAREREVLAGLEALGPGLAPAFDSETGAGIDEFSRRPCGCCGSRLGGSRHEFALLG